MEKIKLRVAGNVLEVIQRPEIITSGTVGLPVEFEFDSQWEGLYKTAVFKAGDKTVSVPNPETGTVVPWEVLAKPNVFLHIGVYGAKGDGSLVIPTLWANVAGVYTGTDPQGDPTTDPALPVWQALQGTLEGHIAADTPLIVNLTAQDGSYTADCSAWEIYEAMRKNRAVYLLRNGNYYPCVHCTGSAAKFDVLYVSNGIIKYTAYTLQGTGAVTVTEVGAAPAGYGLSEDSGKACGDYNTAVLGGMYAASGTGAANSPGEYANFKYSTLSVEARLRNRVHQRLTYDTYAARRVSTNGGSSWGAWEYENPPMAVNVEYRTTERFMGKPVYAKMINFGELPYAYGEKIITFSQTMAALVRVVGYARWVQSDDLTTFLAFPTPYTELYIQNGRELVVSDQAYAGCSACFAVYYTKE